MATGTKNTVNVDRAEYDAMRDKIAELEAQLAELKSQENIIHLQKSLSEVETELSAARRAYNSRVLDLNNAVQVFPNSIVAALSNIQKSAMFEAPVTERQNVNVKDHFEA